jgi:hypothetical protein
VPGRLGDAVGREREGEPADERRAERQPERAQPQRGEAAGAHEREEDECVPAGDGAEKRLQRPVDEREGPRGEVRPRLQLGLEAVRIDPGRLAARELMAGKPQVVRRLQVVSRRHAPLTWDAVAEKAVGLEHGR